MERAGASPQMSAEIEKVAPKRFGLRFAVLLESARTRSKDRCALNFRHGGASCIFRQSLPKFSIHSTRCKVGKPRVRTTNRSTKVRNLEVQPTRRKRLLWVLHPQTCKAR